MTLHTGPSSKKPKPMNLIVDVVNDQPNDTAICALVLPVGIQVQLFFSDYSLESALYSVGTNTVEITHIVYQAYGVPQHAMSDFLMDNCDGGIFDISGVLYISPESFGNINKDRAVNGKPTFRYMESAMSHILNKCEYCEELRFTPNWSNVITSFDCISSYKEFLEVVSVDFEVMPNKLFTAGSIEYVRRFGEEVNNSYNNTSVILPKSIVLFKDDISKKSKYSCAESNIIAEVLLINDPTTIKIEAIDIEPDRFGRVRPVISSNEVTHYEYEFCKIDLPSLEYLAQQRYRVGDVVDVSFINRIPKLGRVVKTADAPSKTKISDECLTCAKKLIYRHGQLYCPNTTCPSTVLYRTLYANSKRVLDLPFNWHSLFELVVNQGIVGDIPSLLNLDRLILDQVFDTEMVNLVLKTLKTRINQLNGNGYKKDVQLLAQTKFLDALSIDGLHFQNIKRLSGGLVDQEWYWSDLPLVLTNHTFLRGLSIPARDVVDIVNSAKSRGLELDTLVREF